MSLLPRATLHSDSEHLGYRQFGYFEEEKRVKNSSASVTLPISIGNYVQDLLRAF
jgi:hypothetical protein